MTDLERVASAIYEADRAGQATLPWARLPAHRQASYHPLARAAVEALMEPSEAMIEAADEFWPDRRSMCRAMLQSVLNEDGEKR